VPDYLLTIPAIILVFFLPGLSFARAFRIRFTNPAEIVFYSISLSFAFVVGIGFTLGNTIGINTVTVFAAYILVGIVGAGSVIRELWIFLSRRRSLWQTLSDHTKRVHFDLLFGVMIVAVITASNWSSAIGTHAIDMGEHVFWAKTIVATGTLPNYLSVEPLDQAVKFTYGAHLMLAQFFILSGIPIEDYSWIPTLIGSIAVSIGVALFAFRVTGSKWASIIAAVLYGSAYQPGGYIERGNLPDIAGYLLLISTLCSILRVRKNPSFSYALGLTTVSVIPYHQLATVILPTLIVFALMLSYFQSRSELMETLRTLFTGRYRPVFWAAMLLLAAAYAGTATYVSGSAASQLLTGNWRPYVVPLYLDLVVPGLVLGALGIAGFIVSIRRKTLSYMLLLSWFISLLFLANALLIGIPLVDPGRFLWRLTEPLSILAAIFASVVVTAKVLKTCRNGIRVRSLIGPRRDWIQLAAAILVISMIVVQVSGMISSQPSYRAVEAFLQDDKRIGQWLAVNASSAAVTANDADVDQTATWVQVYSMKLHFIYRADFAATVAPASYIQIYKNMAILYESPSDARVPLIIQQYNLTYVVAHTDEIPLFSSSRCFGPTPIFESGGSALFASRAC
jgi:hypothetical protein